MVRPLDIDSHLTSFNAKFRCRYMETYDIDLKLIGKFTALLFDTPLSYACILPLTCTIVLLLLLTLSTDSEKNPEHL
jgi:hypothetical protein